MIIKSLLYLILVAGALYSSISSAGCTYGTAFLNLHISNHRINHVSCDFDINAIEPHQIFVSHDENRLYIEHSSGWLNDGTREPDTNYLITKFPVINSSYTVVSRNANHANTYRVYLKTPARTIHESSTASDHGFGHDSAIFRLGDLNLTPTDLVYLKSGRVSFCRETTGFVGTISEMIDRDSSAIYSLNSNKPPHSTGSVQTATSCQLIQYHLEKPTLSKSGVEVSNGQIDTNGGFSLTWNRPENEWLLPKLYRSVNNEAWIETAPTNKTQAGSNARFTESGLTDGNYRYKLKLCSAGLCEESAITSIKVERTPSIPVTELVPRYLSSNELLLDWSDVTFASNSVKPRYKLSYASKAHDAVVFSAYESLDIASNSPSEYSVDFIRNNHDYKFKIAACNTTCSTEVEFTYGAESNKNIFEAVFKPNNQANVLPVNSISVEEFYTQLPPGDNGEAYLSNSGSYKLQLSSLNATQFAIREYRQVKGSEVVETSEIKWVPVAIDPVVIIPITEYTQTTVETTSPILGDENGDPIYSRVNKTLNKETVVSPTFNQSQSGEYFYTVMACNRIGDDSDTKDENCVTLPQVTVTVDLKISQPSAALFKVNDGELEIIFENNAAPVTYFQIFDANNQSIGRFDNNDAGLAAAVLALQNAGAGYSLVACNASSCTTPIGLTLPPTVPSYVNVSGNSRLGYGHRISWPNSTGASSYILEIEVVNPENTSEVWLAKHTIKTNSTSYVFPEEKKIFGLHRYRVMAENDAGQSPYSDLIGYKIELDPTVYIRKQLYYAYEDSNQAIQVGDDIEGDVPQDGLYDRNKAAFRYLDLMYSKQVAGESIEIRGEADLSIASAITNAAGVEIYGEAERQKAKIAERFIRDELAGDYANNSNVQQLLLDVYFDRAVAEFYLANAWRDRARVLRFTDQAGNNFEDEIAYTINATNVYENALFGDDTANNNLPGYANLLDYSNASYRTILLTHAKGRGQISPRYWQGETAFKIVKDDERDDVLASGYKDLTLIYELMAAVLESKVEEAKLRVIAGESNSILLDVDESALLVLKEKVNALHNSLLDEEGGLFKNELEQIITNADWSGFTAAKARYISADAKAQTAIAWLSGDSNILGLPNDMMVFNYDESSNLSSYDVFMSDINNSSSAYNQVITNFAEAKNSYDIFRSNNDAASSYATNHVAGWVTQLKDLIGYDCSESCEETVSGWQISQISLQAKAVMEAQINAEIAEEQLDGLYQKILNKQELLETIYSNNSITKDVILDYGHMQIDIGKRITKLEIDAARRAARKSSRFGIKDFVSAGITGGGNPLATVAALGVGIANKQEQWNISKIGINASKNIGALTALSAELALEQQVEIHKLTSDSQEAALTEQIEAMWVDANLLALNIEQAAVRVEIEADQLTLLMNKAQYAIDKIASNSETLINRYFTDPVHARRVTYAMDAAYLGFEAAQVQLFLTANALEYKLGLNLIDDTGFNKNDIFKARTHEDLSNFKDAMVAYEQNNNAVPQQAYARFSVKEDVFGFKSRLINTYIEPQNPWEDGYWEWQKAKDFDHPDPAKTERLEANDAFTQTLLYAKHQFDNFESTETYPEYNDWAADKPLYFYRSNDQTWMAIRFDTTQSFNDLTHGTLFRGPSFADESGDVCYQDLGTYADKINKVAVLATTANNISGLESVGLGLRYGGYSYLRRPEAPDLQASQSEDSPDYPVQGIVDYQILAAAYKAGLSTPYDTTDDIAQDELDTLKDWIKLLSRQSDVESFDTRFWSYDYTTGDLTSINEHRLSNETRLVDSSIPSNNLESELSGYWLNGLKERSVASSKWVIEMPIESDSRGGLIALNYLKDIELIFDHEFMDRKNTYGDMCPSP